MTPSPTEAGIRALLAELDSAGDLPAGFGALLERVPREHFIPDHVWVAGEPIDRTANPAGWYRQVYRDVSITTQFDDGTTPWPAVGDRPTCSASQPSVIVGMLDALHADQGHAVLEIGTGTGFNAQLLAAIVGDKGSVTTMEIDSGLAELATQRLCRTGLGHRPVVCVGDATAGCPDRAPFDRIINTMAVPLGRIPYAWVQQTKPGGTILTPVHADLINGPLVRFIVHDDATATGQTLPMGVRFMESRVARTPRAVESIDFKQTSTDESVTTVKPWPMLDDPASRWALAVALPSCRYDIQPSTNQRPYKLAWLADPVSSSWASVVPLGEGRYKVRQHGVRRLWDEAEAAYRWWNSHNRPGVTDWHWTITPDYQTITIPSHGVTANHQPHTAHPHRRQLNPRARRT